MTELGDFMEHMKQFRDDEKLFRAARPSKFFISKNGQRLSSVAFKNRPKEEYVSVTRQSDRTVEECVSCIRNIPLEGAIVSVTYLQCQEIQVEVIPYPSEKNPYHCGLINGEENAESSLLTDIQCQDLADAAVIEFKDF